MDKQTIYQHFRSDESAIIDELSSLMAQAATEYRPILTEFLNPREVYIAQTLLNTESDLKMKTDGLLQGAERQRVLFYPEYYEPSEADFELSLIWIKYPTKFATLKHSQILGALTHIGLRRNLIGDIVTDDERWQFITAANMVNFLKIQVETVGRVKVHLEEVDKSEIVSPIDEWQGLQVTVSSLRLDTLIAGVYNLSRKHVKDLLNAGKVVLNWMDIEKPDVEVAEHDIVSVRGYGRFRLKALQGVSKKGKIRVELDVLKK
ncbi:YlmH/Sll1252 family protein [Liquorilactobacillus mali]|uniref:RNA binding protein n=1 Tax=Liquorilactobacillus mali TaxID=1618 RepID=A0A0R2G0M7_9LACO|nr:YlmH/Sll1252 family protein [Liquorilactobacillus mali]KRN34323.1 RNA binding protein [Liquorilactobacillus mali]MDN7144478.1 YlmH/Sll1252 family protein [Liquorilactobacillus mali]